MSVFKYDFMVRAFLVGGFLAVIIPCIGVFLVLRRQSMMGDALSHASLVGVAGGLITGLNPVIGALLVTVMASLGIEIIRKKIPDYAEVAIAIIMSAGIGISGILFGFIKNATGFNSFLFGSIVAISDMELYLVIGNSLFVLIAFIGFYRELFYIALDERSARLAGVPVRFTGMLFTILTGLTVAIASRTVGTLMVSSLMVVPVATAMQLAKSFRQTAILSVCFGLLFTFTGLWISFYANLRPGATIVTTGIIIFLIVAFTGNYIFKRGVK